LILVNHDHPLPCDYQVGDLACAYGVLMEAHVAKLLSKLLAQFAGKIIPVSGYRCGQEQTDLYAKSLRENGEEFTKKYVARPNHSEHQTGLAVDLALNLPHIDLIRPRFPYTGICATFRDEVHKLGFIERYPKGKEPITRIAHEPWHFRYVGAIHAQVMREAGITLEEYHILLHNY